MWVLGFGFWVFVGFVGFGFFCGFLGVGFAVWVLDVRFFLGGSSPHSGLFVCVHPDFKLRTLVSETCTHIHPPPSLPPFSLPVPPPPPSSRDIQPGRACTSHTHTYTPTPRVRAHTYFSSPALSPPSPALGHTARARVYRAHTHHTHTYTHRPTSQYGRVGGLGGPCGLWGLFGVCGWGLWSLSCSSSPTEVLAVPAFHSVGTWPGSGPFLRVTRPFRLIPVQVEDLTQVYVQRGFTFDSLTQS